MNHLFTVSFSPDFIYSDFNVPFLAEECDENTQYQCPGTPLQCIKLEDLCVDKKPNNDCLKSVCSSRFNLCKDYFLNLSEL